MTFKHKTRIKLLIVYTAVFFRMCFTGALAGTMPADEVEFRLLVEPSVGALMEYAVLWGHGWFRPDENSANWTGRAPVTRYCKIPVGFRFIPESNGWATLDIKGFAASEKDDANTGVEISNVTVTGAGESSAELKQKLKLFAEVPVTVRFETRAATPENYSAMPRITSTSTPAHKANRFLRRGVNFGNLLEAPPGEDWGAVYVPADFDAVKREGFDHIRIPCAWHHHMTPDFEIDALFFEQVSAIVTQAISRGLAVVINWHHFDDLTDDPAARRAQFNAGWQQIAGYYAGKPGRIAFELLNEPRNAASGEMLNTIYAEVIPLIRAKAPGNTIIAGPAEWNSAWELKNLRLPGSDSNIIVSVHNYTPFLFTHQGASWTAPDTDTTGIVFPGPPSSHVVPAGNGGDAWIADWFKAYNTLPAEWNPCGVFAVNINLRLARAWSEYYGRPVRIGEWGCIVSAPENSRRRYYATKRRLLDESGLSWTIWDWKSNFRYWNPETALPMPGLRQALFPK